MSAYKHAMRLSSPDTPERVELAVSLLHRGEAVVLLDGLVALRPAGDAVLCEVVDWRCGEGPPERLEALLQSGRELVGESALAGYLRTKALRWIVVEDYGLGTHQVWPLNKERE